MGDRLSMCRVLFVVGCVQGAGEHALRSLTGLCMWIRECSSVAAARRMSMHPLRLYMPRHGTKQCTAATQAEAAEQSRQPSRQPTWRPPGPGARHRLAGHRLPTAHVQPLRGAGQEGVSAWQLQQQLVGSGVLLLQCLQRLQGVQLAGKLRGHREEESACRN